MIKSMTGFGRYELLENNKKICVEIKSVNHRYLDINIRLPRKFSMFESELRNIIKTYALRGKVDVYINYENLEESDVTLKYNETLIKGYLDIFKQISEQFGVNNNISMAELTSYSDVITTEDVQIDEEEIKGLLEKALTHACESFTETRIAEGERLKADMEEKLAVMLENVEYIVARAPKIIDEYRENLENKVAELLAKTDIDESRIAMEVTLYADKTCIDEELVRLQSHIAQVKDTFNSASDIGRKLDFIAQEMNREANTILSKSSELDITNVAIQLKTDIEKIREQVQNIE